MLKVDIKYVKEVFGDVSKITSDFCTPFKTCRVYGDGTKILIITTSYDDFYDESIRIFARYRDMTVEYIHKKKHLLVVVNIKNGNKIFKLEDLVNRPVET